MLRTIGAIACLVAVAGAGCLSFGDSGKATNAEKNRPPTAEMQVGDDTVWTGDPVSFTARGSQDPDGRIASYRYDFGDGTPPMETTDENASVRHVYAHGGEFAVTLTVTDDGGETSGALTDTAMKTVVVNEEIPVATQVLQAGPAEGTNLSVATVPFEVYQGANRFELTLDVTNNAPLGASQVEVELLDPDNDTLDREELTVSGTQTQTLTMTALARGEEGTHLVRITAKSGSAIVEGNVQAIYGLQED